MKGGVDKFSKSFLFRDTQKESEESLKLPYSALTWKELDLEELFGHPKEAQAKACVEVQGQHTVKLQQAKECAESHRLYIGNVLETARYRQLEQDFNLKYGETWGEFLSTQNKKALLVVNTGWVSTKETQDETGEYVSNVVPTKTRMVGIPVEPLTAFQAATAVQADYLNPLIPFKEVQAKIKQFELTYGKTFGEVLRMGGVGGGVVSIRPIISENQNMSK